MTRLLRQRLLRGTPFLRGTAAVLGLLLALPTAAMADDMPQLDFKNPLTLSQVVWGTLLFILLYLLLARWALPQVKEVLDHRAEVIAGDLDAARAAKQAGDAAVAELNAAVRSAQAGAQAEIAGAVASAKEVASAQSAELNAQLDARLAAAEQQIAVARASALGALRQVATEAATMVVTRLTGAAADAAAVDSAVGAALSARAIKA